MRPLLRSSRVRTVRKALKTGRRLSLSPSSTRLLKHNLKISTMMEKQKEMRNIMTRKMAERTKKQKLFLRLSKRRLSLKKMKTTIITQISD